MRGLVLSLLLAGGPLAAAPAAAAAYDSYAWGRFDDAPEENFVQRALRSHGTEIMFGLAAAGFLGFLFLMGPGDVLDAWRRTGRMYGRRRGGFGGLGGFGGDDR
ncbi:MAG: hypothetical protein RDU13_03785 [Elusimicrobiales bacterium]|jgi:hypothetical protein|nr:hypothetical protein [Elusimicrobiales bacterium]